MPGYLADDSIRGMGVATGSMETAERMGKMRSMEVGLKVTPASSALDGDEGGTIGVASDRPVNMLT